MPESWKKVEDLTIGTEPVWYKKEVWVRLHFFSGGGYRLVRANGTKWVDLSPTTKVRVLED